MNITIYGTGCPTCKSLYESTLGAVRELNLPITVQYITDIQKMIEIGLMQSPAIVIDGVVAHAGSSMEKDSIKNLIVEFSPETETKMSNNAGSGGVSPVCRCGGKC
jgi:small redox-active disulfide protein 2